MVSILVEHVLQKGVSLKKIKIGISSCLLGEKVRFDGGNKRQPFLVDSFGLFVEWVPICPEVELGLGVPRPTLRLEADKKKMRLVMPKKIKTILKQ